MGVALQHFENVELMTKHLCTNSLTHSVAIFFVAMDPLPSVVNINKVVVFQGLSSTHTLFKVIQSTSVKPMYM